MFSSSYNIKYQVVPLQKVSLIPDLEQPTNGQDQPVQQNKKKKKKKIVNKSDGNFRLAQNGE